MQPLDYTGPDSETAIQASRGKLIPYADLQRTAAGFTLPALDGYGLRCLTPTRPALTPHDPVPVRRLAPLLHAAFRPRLTTTPLRFANPSPPSSWIRDLHPQVGKHAWQTSKKPIAEIDDGLVSKDSRGDWI